MPMRLSCSVSFWRDGGGGVLTSMRMRLASVQGGFRVFDQEPGQLQI